ncbi:MAG: histidine phosphatase family protein [Ginsengibacter sp.]
MEIYLVRHIKPAIGKDVCYGQTDIPIDESLFEQTAKDIFTALPTKADVIYSSPLIRCSTLGQYLLQNKYHHPEIKYSLLLKELNFGEWENKKWNDINQVDLQKWMNNFVNESVPGGENFLALHQRTRQFLDLLAKCNHSTVIIVTHAGVIRSIASHIQQTALKDAFAISCAYGSVKKLELKSTRDSDNIT